MTVDHPTPHPDLSVTDVGGVRYLRHKRTRQSSMLLSDPFETDFEYSAYLHVTVAVKPEATRVLVIGLGGGMLIKRMWRDYPRMHLDVVEVDEAVVQVARDYFGLPEDERINIVHGEGRRFVGEAASSYDIIVVDAFDDDRIPRPLTTEEFLRQARDHLAPDGVIAYNFIGPVQGDYSRPFRSFHRTAANVWRRVWVFRVKMAEGRLPGPNDNVVLVATDAELPTSELLDRIANRVGGQVSVPAFETFGEDLHTRPIRTGDVPIITDPRPPRRTSRSRGGRTG
ncbi:MAG: fused MFS/spermidine synthase [Coriobacteriales bacterium]|nr:fused MFS/spermidine synthase [Coriobacteriales bacterium]